MGHLNGFFVPRGGNLNKPIFKSSNAREVARGLPGGVARGGMLNFRIDRRINEKRPNSAKLISKLSPAVSTASEIWREFVFLHLMPGGNFTVLELHIKC